MNPKNEKCVMIINQNLPAGVAANTAAIMGISLGKQKPQIVGPDVADKNGRYRPGIIEFPVPILKGSSETCRRFIENFCSRNSHPLLPSSLQIWPRAAKPTRSS